MFTTRHSNGHLHSRPMTTQNAELDDDSSLWFFMSRKGDPVADIRAEPIVNLVYADPGDDTYVSVSGTAAVVEDKAKKQQLWSKLALAWFPGGVDDPSLVLVTFRPTRAEYWDNTGFNKIACLWEAARAYVSGETPRTKEGKQHGVVSLS